MSLLSVSMDNSNDIYCLQESIRNSADGMLLSAPDSLVVSITKHADSDENQQYKVGSPLSTKGRNHQFGIDALDMLKFTYKVFVRQFVRGMFLLFSF